MLIPLSRRFTILASASAVLAGCATQNKPIVLDRQAMAGIKRIGLPTVGVPRSPDVMVTNGISTQMAGMGLIGAIGGISGLVVRANRSDAVVRMMAQRSFDPGPALTEQLASNLGAKGFTVVPLSAAPKRQFLPSVPAAPEYDAVLDCYISGYGFVALDDSDSSPYRATIVVPVRLIGPGGVVLMQDTVAISGVAAKPSTPGQPVTAPADASGTFRSFSDAEKDPAAAVDALRAVFADAASGIVRRVS